MFRPPLPTLLAAGLLISAHQAHAQSDDPLTAMVEAGLAVDSGLAVPEVDLAGRTGAALAVGRLDLRYAPVRTETFELELGYEANQSLHFEDSAFDRTDHRLSLFADYVLSSTTSFSLSYDFTDSNLDGDGLLQVHRVNPTIGYSLGQTAYLIAGYAYEDLHVPFEPARSGHRNRAEADLYFFLRFGTILSLGLDIVRERTAGDPFDYNGAILALGAEQPLRLWGKPTKIRLDYSLDRRNYTNITPAIGEKRDDRRHEFAAGIDMDLTDSVTARLGYRLQVFSSDFQPIDYTSNRFGLRLGVKF